MSQADVIICRCEEVRVSDIERAMDEGAATSQEIKMRTRAGMGSCQGRVCRCLLETLTGELDVEMPEEPSRLTIHFPVRPVRLDQIVKRES